MRALLNQGAFVGKFAVAEFADGDIGVLRRWMDAVGHRSSAFDFPLHFLLKTMCNDAGSMDMGSLDHAGLTGADPLGAVTFVENHDSDRGGIGGPTVRNKMLAYAYILTTEGYPCVFYRDYSTDQHCFGLKNQIDPLIWIHEHLADGPAQQRWKDAGVFAFERMGGGHLLVGLNKDAHMSRTITVQTGFGPHVALEDFAGHRPGVNTDANASVTITIPQNTNGLGYVCYARPAPKIPFVVHPVRTAQEYEGAADLDIAPAGDDSQTEVCRVFADAHTDIEARLVFDASHWTPNTQITLELHDQNKTLKAHRTFDRNASGASLKFNAESKGFHAFLIRSSNTPAPVRQTAFKLLATYQAPQRL
jgi:alpha-amylase